MWQHVPVVLHTEENHVIFIFTDFSSLSNILGFLDDAFPLLVMTNISHLFCSVDYLAILNFFLSLGGQSGAGNSERYLIHSIRI